VNVPLMASPSFLPLAPLARRRLGPEIKPLAYRMQRHFRGARRCRRGWDTGRVTPEDLAHLRRARDLMDRDYAKPLDVPAMARQALMSPAHFSRQFRAAYGETPWSYLMTRETTCGSGRRSRHPPDRRGNHRTARG